MPVPALNARALAGWALAAALLCAPAAAGAACSVSATAVSFGSYNPLSPLNTDATGTVTVTCSGLLNVLVSYEILLSRGGAGTYTPRRMACGSNTLNYNLYTDITRTTIWGDNTGGSSRVTGSILVQLLVPTSNLHTVYGRIPAQQNAAAGTYADSITVTVNY
ncbi:MAG TPA: spore coat U domain-containing protein [Nevskiales bacterium]|nr:spore coat U domain-containing protein [Nevskiales bacterium]